MTGGEGDPPVVAFCAGNPGKGVAMRRIGEEFPRVAVEVRECLGRCTICREGPFAVLGDEVVRGADPEDLFRNIAAALAG